jgi:hypothetical protein
MATATVSDIIVYRSRDVVNEKYCRILSKLTFSQFKKFYDNPEDDCSNDDMKTQYSLLISYCNEQIKQNFHLKTRYKYGRNKTSGRMFVDGMMGLQRIWKKFRGVLCNGIYTDFDIKSAHPTILLNIICKPHGIYCYNLNEYVMNRDKHFTEMEQLDGIPKAECKMLFLKAINKDTLTTTYNKKKIKYDFFLKFDKEMKDIQRRICELNPEMVRDISKTKKENIQGSVINNLLCMHENEILQRIIKSYQNKEIKFKVGVPMFDGFMVVNDDTNYTSAEILDYLNGSTKEIGIVWDIKPHDISIEEELNDLVLEPTKMVSGVFDNHTECAKYILENLLDGRLFNCKGETYYSNDRVLYFNDERIVNRKLLDIISDCDLWIGSNDKIFPLKDVADMNKIIKLLLAKCPDNPDFHNQLYDTTLHKVCFKNGYYDFDKKQFLKYDGSVKTAIIIPIDYNDDTESQQTHIQEIYKKVLYPIFSVKLDGEGQPIEDDKYNYMRYQLKYLSRRLAGYNEDKLWGVWQGARNSGKSALIDFIKYTYGDYIGCPQASLFEYSNLRSEDPNKQMGWLIDYQLKRLAVCQEQKEDTSDKSQKSTIINGSLLKVWCSGGDGLTARRMRENPITFRMQGSVLFCCNNMPEVHPKDTETTMNSIVTNTIFLKQEQIDKRTPDEQRVFYFHPIDTTIKTHFVKNPIYQHGLIHLFKEAFYWDVQKPQVIQDDEDEYQADPGLTELLSCVRFTGNETDRIFTSHIQDVLENKINPKKLKAYLINMGGIEFKSMGIKGYIGFIMLKYKDAYGAIRSCGTPIDVNMSEQ